MDSLDYISDDIDQFLTRAYAQHDSAHDRAHALRVYATACKLVRTGKVIPLAALTPGDIRIFQITILFHDARDHKMDPTQCLSAAELRQFYEEQVGPTHATIIEHIHANCSWSNRKTYIAPIAHVWMWRVLRDADWLDAIGETGLRRCIEFTRLRNGRVPEDVIDHIKEKLLLIPDALHYNVSKKLCHEQQLLGPLLTYLDIHGTLDDHKRANK